MAMSSKDMMGKFGGMTNPSNGAPNLPSPTGATGARYQQSNGKTAVMDMDGDQDGDVVATTGAPRALPGGMTSAPVSVTTRGDK